MIKKVMTIAHLHPSKSNLSSLLAAAMEEAQQEVFESLFVSKRMFGTSTEQENSAEKIDFNFLLDISKILDIEPIIVGIYVIEDKWPHSILGLTIENKKYFILSDIDFKKIETISKNNPTNYKNTDPTEINKFNSYFGIPIKFVDANKGHELIYKCLNQERKKS